MIVRACDDVLLFSYIVYLNMAHSYDGILLMLSSWYLLWLVLLHHWLGNPWFQHERGSHYGSAHLIYWVLSKLCFVLLSHLYFRCLNPYLCSLVHIFGSALDDRLPVLTCAWEWEGCALAYYPKSVTLVDKTYAWFTSAATLAVRFAIDTESYILLWWQRE